MEKMIFAESYVVIDISIMQKKTKEKTIKGIIKPNILRIKKLINFLMNLVF